MANKKFAIIHNLEGLSSEELAQYLRDASVYFKLDPDLNGLDTIWMNAEDGMRKLVVYARKGTTDILREIHGISVTAIVRDDSFPGCAVFMATGKNPAGRQEMAVGAHAIEGLKGERLAYAIMTAQTRSGRRLTLQFVGGGLLDVSEVNAQTADISTSPASLAQLSGNPAVIPPVPLPMPTIAVSGKPGIDITGFEGVSRAIASLPGSPVGDGKLGFGHDRPKVSEPDPTGQSIVCLDCKRPLSDHPLVNSARTCPESPKMSAIPEHSVAQNPPNQGVSLQSIAAKPADTASLGAGILDSSPESSEQKPKTRTRKKRGQVDIASPGQSVSANVEIAPKTETPAPAPPPPAPIAVAAPAPIPAIVPVNTTQTMTLPAPAVAPAIIVALPASTISPEKQKEFQVRLGKYSSDILPKAGMMPSVGIGGSSFKLRKFAAQLDGIEDWRNRNEEQWEELFTFLDTFTIQNGAPALVQYINKAIGVTE